MRPVLPWQPLPIGKAPDLFQLLTWRTRLAPLVGRDSELDELLSWANSGCGVRARFLTGEGGAGKTRLSAEVAQRLRDSGWTAGFTNIEDDIEALLDHTDQSLLLLVDYPEQNRPRVQEVLKRLAEWESPSMAVRLLLLSRQALTRWQQVVDDAGATALCDSQSFEVRPLSAPEAVTLCHAVWPRLRDQYDFPIPNLDDAKIAAWVEQNPALHGRPLFVTAAALHSAIDLKGALSPGGKMVEALVRWELKRLRVAGKGHGFQEGAVSRLVALAAVSGGLSLSALRRLAAPELEVGLPSPAEVVDAVSRLPWGTEQGVVALSPDIVAAALLHEVLSQRPDMASEWLWTVLQDQAETNEQGVELVVRLDRIGFDIRTVFGPKEHRFDEWLSQMVEGKLDRAKRLQTLEYHEVHDGALLLVVSILQARLQDRDLSPEDQAALWNNLGKHARNLGDHKGALEATLEAVGIGRRLAESHRVDCHPYLALSLNNLGSVLTALGDHEGALEATLEAVGMYRQLADRLPAGFLPDLAASLNNLGSISTTLGHRADALEATQEAVGLRRQLADSRPETFLPDFAATLNNLGLMLLDLGHRKDALEATQEALGIFRRLADSRPETFLPDLAATLNNLGLMLSDLGHHEDALEATQEAVGVRRQLADSRPEAFLPDLATSLNNLGLRLNDLQDRKGAFEAAQEAAGIFRQLADSQPETFLPGLATSVNNLGIMLSAIGNHEGALEAAQEAVGIRRQLAGSHPDAFLSGLAMSLTNLGSALNALGQSDGALDATREAIDIYRKLAKDHPEAFLPDLATSLNNLGIWLGALRESDHALEATQEAVVIRCQLIEVWPLAFVEKLAGAASELERHLKESGLPLESNPVLAKARALLAKIGQPV